MSPGPITYGVPGSSYLPRVGVSVGAHTYSRPPSTLGVIEHMIDRKISAGKTVAYTLWAAGFLCIAASFVLPLQVAAIGLFLAGAGGVLTIRGYVCALQQREQNAFDIGRDYEQGMTAVRRVR